jgi:hypothetical protein
MFMMVYNGITLDQSKDHKDPQVRKAILDLQEEQDLLDHKGYLEI